MPIASETEEMIIAEHAIREKTRNIDIITFNPMSSKPYKIVDLSTHSLLLPDKKLAIISKDGK